MPSNLNSRPSRQVTRLLTAILLAVSFGAGGLWWQQQGRRTRRTDPAADLQEQTVPSADAAIPAASYAAEPIADQNTDVEPVTDTKKADVSIVGWRWIDELPHELALFDTVFWDSRDTVSLRERIFSTSMVEGKSVLEIGTGSGLLSICCLASGAERVVATDVNAAAIANARYNAELLGLSEGFEVRQVPLTDTSAFAVIGPAEKFDLIISNPPWEDAKPVSIDEYALYDEGFRLLNSLFVGLEKHLKPGGRLYLAYGCVSAVRQTQRLAAKYNMECHVLDDRNLDELPEVFLPGMLLELEFPAAH